MNKTAGVLLCFSLLFACGPVVKHPSPLVVMNPSLQATEYQIQKGDQLDVRFYGSPELNEQVTVRPDGRISLQLAPELKAAGSTPAELTRRLNSEYSSELRNPRITVIVTSFGSNKVYVGGEVGRPGIMDLTGTTTVLQSITASGGLLDTARIKEVVIIRKSLQQGAQKPLIFTVNLEDVVNGSDMAQDMTLMPYDIVFVPKSTIANLNVWVDQYIRRMIPAPFGIGFTYDFNNNQ